MESDGNTGHRPQAAHAIVGVFEEQKVAALWRFEEIRSDHLAKPGLADHDGLAPDPLRPGQGMGH